MDALLPIPLVNILDKRTEGLLDLCFRVLPVFIKYVFLYVEIFKKEFIIYTL